MPKRRRRHLDRSVERKVVVKVSGKIVKTIRQQISLAAAIRELGRDPVGTEGRLLTGEPITLRRSITRSVRIELVYHADHRPDLNIRSAPLRLNTADAVKVIRAGVPL